MSIGTCDMTMMDVRRKIPSETSKIAASQHESAVEKLRHQQIQKTDGDA